MDKQLRFISTTDKEMSKEEADNLLEEQSNLCALCKENISMEDPWEYHLKQHWIHGGSTQNYNLAIVYYSCHESLHA